MSSGLGGESAINTTLNQDLIAECNQMCDGNRSFQELHFNEGDMATLFMVKVEDEVPGLDWLMVSQTLFCYWSFFPHASPPQFLGS